MSTEVKKTFLAVHDYGMGGVWVLIDARTSAEIEAMYPEFKVVLDRPQWLTEDIWTRIDKNLHFDIDAEPRGLLAVLVAERKGRISNQ